MKFKPTESRGVMMELGPQEGGLPETALAVFNLRKILVPVDFSNCSPKALGYAVPFAEQFGAELTLVHVAPLMPPVTEVGPVGFGGNEDVKRCLENLAEKVRARLPQHHVQTRVLTGEPASEVIRLAKEEHFDLILLATHGRTGLSRLVMGSTAEKVVRYARCPVLVVREREQDFVTEPGLTERYNQT